MYAFGRTDSHADGQQSIECCAIISVIETFYLGTHQPNWLGKTDIPLFVSVRRLTKMKQLPRAKGPWALDSGGFSELSLNGMWTLTVKSYISEVRRYVDSIGNLKWAASMDWMCEPEILKKTGLTVQQHQRRTLRNYQELCANAADLPWVPILQGWKASDYLRHVDCYQKAGIDLSKLPLVGVGTLCRRQHTTEANDLLANLNAASIAIHAFGYKVRGLAMSHEFLQSADSLAWSYRARFAPPLDGCEHRHCNNCMKFALQWREKILKLLCGEKSQWNAPPG